jgi:tRNA (cmo5U34)-methyltransferase
MKVLGIEDFFYVQDKSYDFLAEKSLPYYHEAHKMLVASLCYEQDEKLEIIDLGVGSGVTTAYILKNYPKAHVVGVDIFEEMLEGARKRLMPFKDRVSLVQSDNTSFLKRFDRKVNAVVSAFCIHHLDEEGKKELFRLISDVLLPGGRFLMLDLTTFDDVRLRELARRATIKHMQANVDDKEYKSKWIHHWNNINIPHPADKMVMWLREAGFNAEIVLRNYEVALIAAKPT